MRSPSRIRATRRLSRAAFLVRGLLASAVLFASAGCDRNPPADAGAREPGVSSGNAPVLAAQADTSIPDYTFLQALANHHAGLMFLAHVAEQQRGTIDVRGDATALDSHHHAQSDSIVAVIHREFGRDFLPVVTDTHHLDVVALQNLEGAAFDSAFRAHVLEHHRAGVRLIDEYLPRLQLPRVRALAEGSRAEIAAEVGALSGRDP